VVVLAGRPNSGKSSLYNAMLGEERAIVTEVPGTTRDALEARVEMGGYPFRLVDTAGLRDTDDRVERIGVEVARRYLARADVVLLCVEAGVAPNADEEAFLRELPSAVPVLLVRTKADRLRAREGVPTHWTGIRSEVCTSVRTGEGLDSLRGLLPALVYSGLVEVGVETPVLTRRRQSRAMGAAREAVGAFCRALREGVPAELASTYLRTAETALEDLVGVVSTDEVLDVVFREFCIGK
jgi:tRNA modification GTPase